MAKEFDFERDSNRVAKWAALVGGGLVVLAVIAGYFGFI